MEEQESSRHLAWTGWGLGRYQSKGLTLQVCMVDKFTDITYSMTIVIKLYEILEISEENNFKFYPHIHKNNNCVRRWIR